MEKSHIRIILEHFEEPIFPRTISTYATSGKQIEVKGIDEMLARFEQANLLDCRINAFPIFTNHSGINTQAPNFVMCDLDLMKFRIEKLLLKTLYRTNENIAK